MAHPQNWSSEAIEYRCYVEESFDKAFIKEEKLINFLGVLNWGWRHYEAENIEEVWEWSEKNREAITDFIHNRCGNKTAESEWKVEYSKRIESQVSKAQILKYIGRQVLCCYKTREKQ